MSRSSTLLTVAAFTLLMARSGAEGGGSNPGPPDPNTRISSPAVRGVAVMDPHEAGVTTKAKQATIWLRYGSSTSASVFRIPLTFLLALGCDLTRTQARFLHTEERDARLDDWVPAAIVGQLFDELGIPVNSEIKYPVLTDITLDHCTPDPDNPGPLSDGSAPGILSMEFVVQFRVPR